MDKLKKFMALLDRKRMVRVAETIERITSGKLDGLDIRPLHGIDGHFRCRIGNIRILFVRSGHQFLIYDADFRGNIYKR